jgi:hypothetical protein
VLVAEGLTVDDIVVVRVASAYQVRVPVAQVALKVELSPEQMAGGLAAKLVGTAGV